MAEVMSNNGIFNYSVITIKLEILNPKFKKNADKRYCLIHVFIFRIKCIESRISNVIVTTF